MNKNGIFFTLDILVAIVLVFLFAIFVMSNLSFSFQDTKATDLQLVSLGQDLSLVLYEKGFLQESIDGSNTNVQYYLNFALPNQICSDVTSYLNEVVVSSVSKSGCVEQENVIITKFPLHNIGNNYIVEVKTWVQ